MLVWAGGWEGEGGGVDSDKRKRILQLCTWHLNFVYYNAVVQIYSCCVFCSHFRPPERYMSPTFPFCLICYFRILLHFLSSLYLILFIQYGKRCLYSRTLYSFHNISVLVLVEISTISCCTISCSPNEAVNPYSTLNIISDNIISDGQIRNC